MAAAAAAATFIFCTLIAPIWNHDGRMGAQSMTIAAASMTEMVGGERKEGNNNNNDGEGGVEEKVVIGSFFYRGDRVIIFRIKEKEKEEGKY